MDMKNYCFFLWALLELIILTSCSSDDSITDVGSEITSRSSIIEFKSVDFDIDRYFDSIMDPDRWIQHNSFRDKMDALNLPEDILPLLSTEQLAEACAKHPMSIIFMAYDTHQKGAKVIINNFNGFSELAKRDNFQDALINEYISNFDTSAKLQAYNKEDKEKKFDCIKKYYLEAVFQTDFFMRDINQSEVSRLSNFIESKSLNDELSSEYNKANSLKVLNSLDNRLYNLNNLGLIYQFVQTPFGKNILVFQRSELSQEDIEDYDRRWQAVYPKAKLIASSTSSYNCHFYAWHGISSKKYWMNVKETYNGQTYYNIKNYTTEDGYTKLGSFGGVATVFGTDANYENEHSLLYYPTTGKCISKWGAGPLMEHTLQDMPYDLYYKEFYYKLSPNAPIRPEGADRVFQVGENITLHIQANIAPHLTYSAELLTGKGDDAVEDGKATMVYKGGESINITFHFQGVYDLTIVGKDSSGNIRQTFTYQPLVEI
ncbi:MAG: hypothetical protein HDR74_08325 [Bacteroides sp.]|nr:hypothetical protein [Bacteroidales bacterium]MBD5379873.1 hypothetical protein [Bacteroides sp.]